MEERIWGKGENNQQFLTKDIKKEIAKELKKLLPEHLKNEPLFFSYDGIEIYVKDKCYPFIIFPKKNGLFQVEFYQRTRKSCIYLNETLIKIKKKKLKSNHGKVSSMGKTVLFILGMSTYLAACQSNHTSIKEATAIEVDMLDDEEVFNYSSSNVVLETMEAREYPVEIIEPEIVADDFREITMAVCQKNENGMEKRIQTNEMAGVWIDDCCRRNGVPSSLIKGLFTQERPKYDEFDKKTNNWGQLTSSICGEKIIAPVISGKEVVGLDKIYILSSNYDNYSREDLEDLPIVQELIKDNWEVYQRKEAFYNLENNIRVSVAYFSYLVNKKEDLFLGAMSYHAGYPSVRSSYTYNDLLNGKVNGPDPKYLYHITSYLTDEELEEPLRVYYQNGKIIDYKINNLNREVDYEEEVEHSIRK